jgi:hypothetical protein
MEYGSKIGTTCYDYMIDQNYNKFSGWQEIGVSSKFFIPENVKLISEKVSELTMGVDEKNRKIKVPNDLIINVMNSVFTAYRPPVGDINTRYNVPKSSPTDYTQDLIDQTIELIVNDIRVNLGMQQNNAKLTAWTTVYGDFNEQGLRSHPPIKIRNRKPASMQFNMNY